MRELACLLKKLRKNKGLEHTPLKDFIKPKYFELLVSATKSLCSFQKGDYPSEKVVGSPSLASKSVEIKIL